ncbi:MAG: hypothetical protein ACFCGT_21840 [Sandaracinaceae bacterium]
MLRLLLIATLGRPRAALTLGLVGVLAAGCGSGDGTDGGPPDDEPIPGADLGMPDLGRDEDQGMADAGEPPDEGMEPDMGDIICPVLNPMPAAGQVLVIEAVNLDDNVVELRNVSSETLDLSGWQMCKGPGAYRGMGLGSLAAGASVTFSPPAGLTLNRSDELAVYTMGPFTGAAGVANIRAYVRWGSEPGNTDREDIAGAAGFWTEGDTVDVLGEDAGFVATGDVTVEGGFRSVPAPCLPDGT